MAPGIFEQMEAQAEQLEQASEMLLGLVWQGKAPDARQVLTLLALASSHEQWVKGLVAKLISEIQNDEPKPSGAGARGSNGTYQVLT